MDEKCYAVKSGQNGQRGLFGAFSAGGKRGIETGAARTAMAGEK